MDANETNEQFARRMQDKRVGWQLWELMAWNDHTSQFEYLYSLRRDTETEPSVRHGLLNLVESRGMMNADLISDKRPLIRRAGKGSVSVLMLEISKMLAKKDWGRQGVVMPAWRNAAVIGIEPDVPTLRSDGKLTVTGTIDPEEIEENPLVTKLKRVIPGLA